MIQPSNDIMATQYAIAARIAEAHRIGNATSSRKAAQDHAKDEAQLIRELVKIFRTPSPKPEE